jgi:hypothetical protein
LVIYTDASWAEDEGDRRSVTGLVVQVFGNCVHWQSKKQHTVAFSSAESEVYAVSEGVKEVLWWRRLIAQTLCRFSGEFQNTPSITDTNLHFETSFPCLVPTPFYYDNQASLCIALQEGSHGRSKHVDTRLCGAREYVKKGDIEMKWVKSAAQLADLLTKGVNLSVLKTLMEILMKNSVSEPTNDNNEFGQ